MAKIYRKSDRIKISMGDMTLVVSPLSQHEKIEVQQKMVTSKIKGDITGMTAGVALAIKYAVKGVEGVKDAQGHDYQVKLDNNVLTDESLEELLNMALSDKISYVCSALLNGVPEQFQDVKGNPLEGVEIVTDEKKSQPNLTP